MKRVNFGGYDCVVEKAAYPNGRPALVLMDARKGEQVTVATVNLPDVPAGPGEVFIKDYSENAGMLAALEDAGVVRATGETVRSGFVSVPRAALLPPYRELSYEETVARKSEDREALHLAHDKERD